MKYIHNESGNFPQGLLSLFSNKIYLHHIIILTSFFIIVIIIHICDDTGQKNICDTIFILCDAAKYISIHISPKSKGVPKTCYHCTSLHTF